MEKGKVYLFFSLLFIFTLILGACSSKDTGTNKDSDGSGEITLGIWGASDEIKREQQLIDSFNDKYPEVKVNLVYKSWDSYWNWLTSQASSKDLPDLYKIDPAYVNQYAKLGVMKDLGDLINSSDFDLSNFSPNVLDIHRFEDQQVSLPRDANVIVMAYNKDIFDEADLQYPEDEMSWEQVLELAKKLTLDQDGNNALSSSFDSKRIKQFGLAINAAGTADSVLEPELWSNGARLLDEDHKLALSSPEAIEVLNFFRDLTTKYHVNVPASQMEKLGDDPFLVLGSKRVAMSFIGSWNVQTLKDAGINFDVFLPPKFDEIQAVVQPAGYAMSPYTKNEKAAWKLLSWLAGSEGQKEIAKQGHAIPANKMAFEDYLPNDDSFNKQIFFEAQSKSIPDPYFEDVTKLWWEYIPQKLQLPLNGKGDIEKAVDEIANLWDSKH
ncbi:sugar ABC transporter substrate-binding protein [Lederbergia sp. NSJ-179]|uniref:ABC transporter substrate-binding protein n=1 Tax=Lederbergia sp. NSJ-179 TaxID=2931402 RepID=UPI001FCFE8D0|nr:sugar ABC transporter substrate-binding protein [Lederbergia sp. NSJ-179]MCJ7841551.1 sugar ABC transporter substrate-binding protein [Lederbergia sp. NSJ-179]